MQLFGRFKYLRGRRRRVHEQLQWKQQRDRQRVVLFLRNELERLWNDHLELFLQLGADESVW
jgi:hypothetical protein